MKTKIISCFVFISMMFGVFSLSPQYAFAETVSEQIKDSDWNVTKQLLDYIGVTSNNIEYDNSSVSKNDFAEHLARLMKITPQTSGPVYFTDVDRNHIANVLVGMGVFENKSSNMFSPDKDITVGEAAKALIRMLGYTPYITALGGTDADYLTVIKKCDLLRNSDKMSDKLSKHGLVTLLGRTVNANVSEIQSIRGSNIEYATGDTYIYSNYKIEYVEGFMVANQYTSVDENVSATDTTVMIGKERYVVNSSKFNSYLGQELKAYYSCEESDVCPELIVAVADDDKDVFLELTFDKIVDATQNYVEYLDDNNKLKKAYIDNPLVIYNGVANYELGTKQKNELFLSDNLILQLSRSHQDNKFVIAKAYVYSNGFVVSSDKENGVIYLKSVDDKIISVELDEKYVLVDNEPYDNDKIFDELAVNTFVSYTADKDSESVMLHINTKTINGSVNSLCNEDDSVIVTIENQSYRVEPTYNKSIDYIKLGDSGIFYLDIFGQIASDKDGIKKNNILVGFIFGRGIDDGFDSRILYKIYTSDKQVLLVENDGKIKMDSVSNCSIEYVDSKLAPNGVVIPQLIRFTVNKDNKLRFVDTTAADSETDSLVDVADFYSRKALYLNNNDLSFISVKDVDRGYNYHISDNAHIFVVPPADTISTRMSAINFNYYSGTNKLPYTNNLYYKVKFIKSNNDNQYIDYVLFEADLENGVKYISENDTTYVINDIHIAINASEDVAPLLKTITVSNAGQKDFNLASTAELERKNPDTGEVEFVQINQGNVKQYLEDGDIIQCGTSWNGDVHQIRLVYDHSLGINGAIWSDEYTPYEGTAVSSSRFMLGNINDVYILNNNHNQRDNYYNVLTLSRLDNKDDVFVSFSTVSIKPVIFDDEQVKYKAMLGSLYHGLNDKIIFVQMGYGYDTLKGMVVYN